MARRKQVAAQSPETTLTEDAVAPAAETATAVLEPPQAEQPARQWRVDPFPIDTVNLGDQKVQLQESRKSGAGWQMQIKFGSGAKEEMPSDAVLEFMKSHKVNITTKAREEKEVQMFHWNDKDRAWGAKIDFDKPATSRQKAEQVFKQVVSLVAEERGAGRQR